MNNNDITMKEREISLIDLFFEILLKWRAIVISMLIGAILFAGLSLVQSKRNVAAQQASIESAKVQLEQLVQEQEEAEKEAEAELGQEETDSVQLKLKVLENQMSELELYNVNSVLSYEQHYAEKKAYQEQSVLMQMNPNNVKKAGITFYITSDNMDKTYNIEKAYEDIVRSGQLMEELAEKMDLSTAVVTELVGLERTANNIIEGADTFRVYATHYDEKVCEEMAETIISYVRDKNGQLQEMLGAHEITVIDESVATVLDTNIMEEQKKVSDDIMSMQKTIADLKDRFGKLEWEYYDIVKNGELTELSERKIAEIKESELEEAAKNNEVVEADIETLEEVIETGVTATVGIRFIYIILGMVAAAFVCVCAIFLAYICKNKISATDNLQEIYGINQLGQIPSAQNRKKFLAIIDVWILYFKYRNKRRFSENEALELATVAIKMEAAKAQLNTVFLIGCDLQKYSMAVCGQIKESLNQDNIQVQILNNVLYDAQAMGKLENAQGVVLVEKVDSTLYEEIAKELEFLKRQNISVLGGIIVE